MIIMKKKSSWKKKIILFIILCVLIAVGVLSIRTEKDIRSENPIATDKPDGFFQVDPEESLRERELAETYKDEAYIFPSNIRQASIGQLIRLSPATSSS